MLDSMLEIEHHEESSRRTDCSCRVGELTLAIEIIFRRFWF
jgi:hypothetical protein